MTKLLGICLIICASSLSAQGVKLLGEGEVFSSCSTSNLVTGAVLDVGFKNMTGQPVMFSASITDDNDDQFLGQTVVLDAKDGVRFIQAVELLTNGAPDRVSRKTTFFGGGGCQTYNLMESQTFDITGLACFNGIDFEGAIIRSIELRFDTVCFGNNKIGGFNSTLSYEATLSIYGEDPAPCVPPKFQKLVLPELSPEEDGLRVTVHEQGPVRRLRLAVDHEDPSLFVRDVLWISQRSASNSTPFGTLVADLDPAALLLVPVSVVPGASVEVSLPPYPGASPSLFAQGLSLDLAGRLQLSEAIVLRFDKGR